MNNPNTNINKKNMMIEHDKIVNKIYYHSMARTFFYLITSLGSIMFVVFLFMYMHRIQNKIFWFLAPILIVLLVISNFYLVLCSITTIKLSQLRRKYKLGTLTTKTICAVNKIISYQLDYTLNELMKKIVDEINPTLEYLNIMNKEVFQQKDKNEEVYRKIYLKNIINGFKFMLLRTVIFLLIFGILIFTKQDEWATLPMMLSLLSIFALVNQLIAIIYLKIKKGFTMRKDKYQSHFFIKYFGFIILDFCWMKNAKVIILSDDEK